MTAVSTPRIAFGANRNVGLEALRLLLDAGVTPVLLLVADGAKADCAEEMQALLPDVPVLSGNVLKTEAGLQALKDAKPDYFLSVHYPYIIPQAALDVPTIGTLNLHPAYLPYTRGWHTPTWAIEEQSPYGATLHWVDSGIDTGDIAVQHAMEILPTDTAHSLYQRVLQLEVEVLREALPSLIGGTLPKVPQQGVGTVHAKKDLAAIQKLDPSMSPEARDRRIRALTTNDPNEAAYEERDGVRVAVRYEKNQ